MSMESAERAEEADNDRGRVLGMANSRSIFSRVAAGGSLLLALSSTIGSIAMGMFQVEMELRPVTFGSATTSWIVALVAILVFAGCKMPHLLGQEPGDHWSLCREVLFCMANVAIAVWSLSHSPTGARLAIFSTLFAFFAIVTCIEIVIAMRLTARSFNQSAVGHHI